MANTLATIESQLRELASRLDMLDDAQLAATVSGLSRVRAAFDACWLPAVGLADDRGIGRSVAIPR